ncbi:N-formylglutamate amidohydrolase [Psychroserpens sp.]|uniref:N-formylglutamate amidohydrolase n=1 Tax=Psychroserpens sp. TaxID=2020870 RepID=UPI001B25CD69|nr:N-formylglutamate amidohydrolase [Psychroserpens sp.]MBO6606522.1 N-formylglutamate amidohydrolase [Psychroserpens sp.]MBO6631762.1 N-formylglutamate amidohydrolase [Psychroserpens sp.]MBO6653226.1 N-formylglutamate amidohydrolase [Psychroserpens sp.]MBO6680747.1 N-formylglutamate amidohydrolase [Psychroserpens sp.]MBO6750295.1 N-formylglutamate amidohydrolase [Psychroserpens sp.]
MIECLSIDEIISKINAEETFHAVATDYSLTLKIDDYVHYACGAVHDGHQFRKELWDNCLHTDYERWYEEDPETKNMVISHPIIIAGCDSRFEYDLNRGPDDAVFDTAWGKKLWRKPLSDEMKQKSLQKHHNFYKVVHALISKLEAKFGLCIVYDMHSYNWKRWDREVPTWNLGTSNVDNDRFGEDIELWRQDLSELNFPHEIKSTAKINDTFFGNGYFLKYITKNFQNTLVLATEIAKVYCDEYDYVIYPEVVAAVEEHLRNRLPEHAARFYKKHAR